MDIKKIFQNQWVIGLLLLGIFLATNGYIYGWDDQHVEIPLLKKLIDPSLYPGDYYVDALKVNFMSYLYPILARVISVKQIPAAYLFLYLISRYFLFFFMFKIWQTITKNKGLAILCVLMIILLGRVEEFLYRTFSHQEFALAIIFAGLYFFYKERFVLSAMLLGVAANFHALYSLFPMCYVGVYLLWQRRWKPLFKSCSTFILFAMPFLIWAGKKYLTNGADGPLPGREEWIALYQLACPQNFLFYDSSLRHVLSSFQNFMNGTGGYWVLAALTVLHARFNPVFQQDKKAQSVLLTGWLLLGISFFFSYIIPVRFILDLNLIRNEQFMLFFLMGYLIVLLWHLARSRSWKFFACLIFLPWMRFGTTQAFLAFLIMIDINLLPDRWPASRKKTALIIPSVIMIATGYLGVLLIQSILEWKNISATTWGTMIGIETGLIFCAGLSLLKPKYRRSAAVTALIIPFVFLTGSFIIYHYKRLVVEKTGTGFWQLQRNWIDMQNYVREHTPKDALILVPHDMEMGGFRIRSERSIVMSYRDCGVIGFSYPAAEEWKKRLDVIGNYQVIAKKPIEKALLAGILYYKADYIVSMKYFKFPDNPLFREIYENEAFRLYKVNRQH